MGILTTPNSLITKPIKEDGTIKILVRCQTKNGNQKSLVFPVDSSIYWYPLSPYLDYHYLPNYKHIVLYLSQAATKDFKKQFYLENQHRYPFIEELYNYKEEWPGKYDSVLNLNLGITTKLKSMGLSTWDDYYNQSMIKHNFELLSNTLTQVENDIFTRQDNLAPQTKNYLQYATPEEERLLMDLGMGYRMNQYMQKIVRVRDQLC